MGGGSLFFVGGFYFYMLKISYIVIILYICSRKQYLKDKKNDKGYTRAFDTGTEELLLRLNSGHIQRSDSR